MCVFRLKYIEKATLPAAENHMTLYANNDHLNYNILLYIAVMRILSVFVKLTNDVCMFARFLHYYILAQGTENTPSADHGLGQLTAVYRSCYKHKEQYVIAL
jgi:hypothetical protein